MKTKAQPVIPLPIGDHMNFRATRFAWVLSRLNRAKLTTMLLIPLAMTACVTTSDENESGHLRRANSLAREGLFKESLEEYKQALQNKNEVSIASRNMGMVYVKLGDFKSAARYLEKVISKFEGDFDTNFYLGETYRAQDKYAEAIFRYQKALKIQDSEPKAMKALAWTYFKIRYYAEALSYAKRLKQIAPSDEQGTVILARTLLKLKRSDEALTVIRQSRERSDEESGAYLSSVEGDILFDRGDFGEAARLYRNALGIKPLLAGALLGLGRCLLEEHKDQQAIVYMERAIRIRPQFPEAYYFLGKAFEASDIGKSVRNYRTFIKQASEDPEFVAQVSEASQKVASVAAKRSPHAGGSASNPDLLSD